jgi:hypothetical protein
MAVQGLFGISSRVFGRSRDVEGVIRITIEVKEHPGGNGPGSDRPCRIRLRRSRLRFSSMSALRTKSTRSLNEDDMRAMLNPDRILEHGQRALSQPRV